MLSTVFVILHFCCRQCSWQARVSVSTQRMFNILSAHYFLVFKITILQFSFVDLMKMEDETKIWKLLLTVLCADISSCV